MCYWSERRVVVTGGAGYLGRHLVARLEATGASVFVPRSAHYDLRTPEGNERMHRDAGDCAMLFHLAATVGGIGANMRRPADFLVDNVLMNTLVAEHARRHEVGKLVAVGSVCAYPKWCPAPFIEDNLWNGYPEETNAAYGVAKRALLVHLQALRKQYGFIGVYVIPSNLYGPGDHDDPETSHVIPALIRKAIEAKRDGGPLSVWGTGRASRDFLYVEDCAEALMLAAQWYNEVAPVNVGSGEEVTIADLVQMICEITGYDGEITYDGTRPDGQPRRVLNTRRAWDEFHWQASTPLRKGLRQTVEWWEAEHGTTA